ncbi:MAG: helix-turn-helix domain-containing protein [Halobacteriovoraceae bacterium]|nr:helix-turn-helix domain-containing protein [Halobacteriovoraceae bacterium]MCB9095780.1 helix-turn-helix domain-containing protein [Halobacteriovoraceae bacterium]
MHYESLEDRNYYELLEVSPQASQKDIELAYKKSLNIYSDDSVAIYSLMTPQECEQARYMIEQAYAVLSSPEKRNAYNSAKGLSNAIHSMAMEEKHLREKFNEESRRQSSRNSFVDVSEAVKKFSLDYKIDYDFEQRIENATEFSGPFLKEIREYKGMTLERLSELTKILKTYLIHIEEENFDKLPAIVYTRGFVFQFAKCLKLNADLVTRSYIERFKTGRDKTPTQ